MSDGTIDLKFPIKDKRMRINVIIIGLCPECGGDIFNFLCKSCKFNTEPESDESMKETK